MSFLRNGLLGCSRSRASQVASLYGQRTFLQSLAVAEEKQWSGSGHDFGAMNRVSERWGSADLSSGCDMDLGRFGSVVPVDFQSSVAISTR